ncbi:hypothetical protein ACFL6P_09980, partial [Candidatus Latescibacterota bacterium]
MITTISAIIHQLCEFSLALYLCYNFLAPVYDSVIMKKSNDLFHNSVSYDLKYGENKSYEQPFSLV